MVGNGQSIQTWPWIQSTEDIGVRRGNRRTTVARRAPTTVPAALDAISAVRQRPHLHGQYLAAARLSPADLDEAPTRMET